MDSKQQNNFNLPSRESLKESIEIIRKFRDLCNLQLELGYWATADFPSKHHINKILQVQYRKYPDIIDYYGAGLGEAAISMVPICKSFLDFVKGKKPNNINKQMEVRKNEKI